MTVIKRQTYDDASVHSLKNIHPLLQRIFAIRGIDNETELDKRLDALLSFIDLAGIDKAAERLVEGIEKNEKIIIIGDFDADGATSTALAVSALRSFGVKQVEYLVPNRFAFGYGLSKEIVDEANKLSPSLIVTVDNGISSLEGVARANELNMDVIVTDHHIAGAELPEACAIVNPNQPKCQFASKSLAGVGVIFYVMLAVRRQLLTQNYFEKKQLPLPNMGKLLDLVALGTVADVVPLDKNNRILVHQGIARIRSGQSRAGIRALIEVSKRKQEIIEATDLGFALGPRLNAAGRLDDMSLGIACLLSDDIYKARELAETLNTLNIERRAIENEMKVQALDALTTLHLNENDLPMGLCLYEENWHQGVIGILAGRLKEKFHRPSVVFAKGERNELKGSARSLQGIHIRDLLDEISKLKPSLIIKFGGHAMAAGLSIEEKHFFEFKKIFIALCEKHLTKEKCRGEILTDGPLAPKELTLDIAYLLKASGPWGQAFPEPIFDNEFILCEQRLVGGKHLKMVVQLTTGAPFIDAIAFNIDENKWPNYRCERIHVAYKLDVNYYQGRSKLQLIVEHLEAII